MYYTIIIIILSILKNPRGESGVQLAKEEHGFCKYDCFIVDLSTSIAQRQAESSIFHIFVHNIGSDGIF